MTKDISFPKGGSSQGDRIRGVDLPESKGSGGEGSARFISKVRVIENFKRLYPMPHVMIKARRIIEDPKSDFEQLAAVLQTDPAVAARVVKVANSAYYKRGGSIASVRQAASLLGMRVLTQIITLVSHSKMLGQEVSGYGMEAGSLWRHSLKVAILAELIARRTGGVERSESFLAGLMHDAGKIILNSYLIELNAGKHRSSPLFGPDSVEMETQILGFDHAEIGGELCMKWQLPNILAGAIRFHHMPHISLGNKLSYTLNLADFAAHLKTGSAGEPVSWDEAEGALTFLKLTPEFATEITAVAEERLENFEEDTY